jgi:hypothetical protein
MPLKFLEFFSRLKTLFSSACVLYVFASFEAVAPYTCYNVFLFDY